jgi:hypothetical protein
MNHFAVRVLTFMRARWRWARGRCPRCNRDLDASRPNHMASDPPCPVCRDETQMDLRVWHQYRALDVARRDGVAVPARASEPAIGRGPCLTE